MGVWWVYGGFRCFHGDSDIYECFKIFHVCFFMRVVLKNCG